jgi:hypothetical protein
MKPERFKSEGPRFAGRLRHYHRSGTGAYRTWDEWVDGEKSSSANWLKSLKIIWFLLLFLVLGGLVTGLVIVLRFA